MMHANFKIRNKFSYNDLVVFLFLVVSSMSFAQNKIEVTGTITDDTGQPMVGANVLEKGTKNAISADLNGNYKIIVQSAKSTLVFSYMGYEDFSVQVGQKKSFNVMLKGSANKLDDVVVIGYGSTSKKDLTGSVTSVSGDDLKKLAISNVAEALTGRVAGLQVTSTEGAPDSEVKIRVRGGGSLTQDSSPLYIVDGFPVNNISDISPSDIENISILKDASSTAIYGARGANGVIIITTKKGGKEGGKVSVSYNSYLGARVLANSIDVLSPVDFTKWQYEYALLRSNPASFETIFGPWQPNLNSDAKATNWQKEIFGRMGFVQNHDLGIRGGTDKLSYNFNYTRYDEKAIMLGSQFERNNLSLNLKSSANEKVDLSFTMRYSETQIDGGGTNEQNEISSSDARLRHSVGYSPIPLPGITTDDTDEAISSYLINPFVTIADNNRLQKRKNFNMLGAFSWEIVENLKFKSDFGLDNYNYIDNRFYGRSTYYVDNIPAAENQSLAALIMNDRKDIRFRNANTLNYDFKNYLGKKHKLKILVGEETLNYNSATVTSTLHGFPKFFSFEDAVNLSSQGTPVNVDNFVNPEDKLLSFFARVNYDINNRYLFTATYRADGSSKFLGNNVWGYFPSAAFAWKASEESFLKDVSWVDLVKFRLSYGQAGNNNIPTGQTLQTFTSSSTEWINGITNFWSASKILANPDLKWETTITQNIGLDYELFKGKLNGTVEIYKNITKDLLVKFPVPGTGYDFQYRNMGEIQNTGLETSFNYAAIEKKNYGLNFSFNIGFNKNRINSLGILSDFGVNTNWASTAIGNDFVVRVGEPIGLMYGYVSDGRYEVSDFAFNNGTYALLPGVANASTIVGTVSPGTMKLKDLNGDGIVNVNDQRVIGDANPIHTGGFVINGNVYGFDVSAAFNWSYGNDVYNANKIEFNTSNPNSQFRNLTTLMSDGNRWTNLDPATGTLVTDPAALQSLNANTTMWSPFMQRYVFSDWAVEDGSFIRLNTLTVGYSLPKSVITKLAVTKCRFYVTSNNVFVLTNYSGLDPEVSTRRATPLTPGVDYSPYPRSRQFVFGINLNF
ncbi:MAG: hypothetical protein RLZ77_172 [Bacteroidota bacterium]